MITLQFGGYANYIATHYWNQLSFEQHTLIDSSSHDTYFTNPLWKLCENSSSARPQAYPRTLIFDLKGSFGSLSPSTARYINAAEIELLIQQAASLNTVPGTLEVFNNSLPLSDFREQLFHPPAMPSTYSMPSSPDPQSAPASVLSWSDFLEPILQPQNLFEIHNVQADLNAFSSFADGAIVMQKLEDREAVLDSVRKLVEQADLLLGFQSFVDTNTGFSGFATELFEELRIDYGSARPLMTYAVSEPHPSSSSSHRLQNLHLLNEAFSTSLLQEHSSLFVPLSRCAPSPLQFPHLDSHNSFHSSIVAALAIDALTLPFRPLPYLRRPPRCDDIRSYVNDRARPSKIVDVAFSAMLPLPSPIDLSSTHKKLTERTSLWHRNTQTSSPLHHSFEIYRSDPIVDDLRVDGRQRLGFSSVTLTKSFPKTILPSSSYETIYTSIAVNNNEASLIEPISNILTELKTADRRPFLLSQNASISIDTFDLVQTNLNQLIS